MQIFGAEWIRRKRKVSMKKIQMMHTKNAPYRIQRARLAKRWWIEFIFKSYSTTELYVLLWTPWNHASYMLRSGELIPRENRISRGRLWNEARMSYSDIVKEWYRWYRVGAQNVPCRGLVWPNGDEMRKKSLWSNKVAGTLRSNLHWAHILMLL